MLTPIAEESKIKHSINVTATGKNNHQILLLTVKMGMNHSTVSNELLNRKQKLNETPLSSPPAWATLRIKKNSPKHCKAQRNRKSSEKDYGK